MTAMRKEHHDPRSSVNPKKDARRSRRSALVIICCFSLSQLVFRIYKISFQLQFLLYL